MITPSYGLTATERVLSKLALNFTTASLDSRVTFTRTGNTATVTNSSGYVVPINADLPRFDYNPITLACKGLLIEETRANLILQSEDFSTTWSRTNLNTTGTPPWVDVATSPANTLTADKLTENTATGEHVAFQTFTGTAASYTFSCYLKKSERFFTMLRLSNGTSTTAVTIFNLNTGTIAFTGSGTATITNVGNGWYRCTITGTLAASASCQAVIQILDNSANLSYTGNGTSGLFAWGAQTELGAFATSYIPTTTTALTRNADVATMTGTNFSDWYNQSEGTFKVVASGSYTNVNTSVFSTSDGTANNRTFLGIINSAGTLAFRSVVSGATQYTLGKTGTLDNTTYNCVLGYKNLNNVVYIDAANPGTSLTGNNPTVDRIYLGNDYAGGTTNGLNGYLKLFYYYPQRLTNNEVQAVSQ